MTPQVTLKALDGSDIILRLRFMLTPFGHCFMLEELRDGDWIGGPSSNPWFSQDLNPIIAEINAVGLRAFIEKYCCPWVRKAIRDVYGPRVKVSTAPPPAAETVTAANIVAQVNGALDGYAFVTAEDGLPELREIV